MCLRENFEIAILSLSIQSDKENWVELNETYPKKLATLILFGHGNRIQACLHFPTCIFFQIPSIYTQKYTYVVGELEFGVTFPRKICEYGTANVPSITEAG